MAPARQRLEALDAALGVVLRLVEQAELVLLQGFAHLVLQRQALAQGLADLRREELEAVLAALLGMAQRGIGAAQGLAGILGMLGQGNAAAGQMQVQPMAVVQHGLGQFGLQMGHMDPQGLVVHGRHQQHGELVGGQPGDLVAGPAQQPEALADGLQHGVAGGMAVLVVDLLEIVQVEDQQRRPGLLLQQPLEQGAHVVAVGQVGQRVEAGQVAGAALDLLDLHAQPLGQRPGQAGRGQQDGDGGDEELGQVAPHGQAAGLDGQQADAPPVRHDGHLHRRGPGGRLQPGRLGRHARELREDGTVALQQAGMQDGGALLQGGQALAGIAAAVEDQGRRHGLGDDVGLDAQVLELAIVQAPVLQHAEQQGEEQQGGERDDEFAQALEGIGKLRLHGDGLWWRT